MVSVGSTTGYVFPLISTVVLNVILSRVWNIMGEREKTLLSCLCSVIHGLAMSTSPEIYIDSFRYGFVIESIVQVFRAY